MAPEVAGPALPGGMAVPAALGGMGVATMLMGTDSAAEAGDGVADDMVHGTEAVWNDVTGGGAGSGAAGGYSGDGSARMNDFANSGYQIPPIPQFPAGLSAGGELVVQRETLLQVARQMENDIATLDQAHAKAIGAADAASSLRGWATADQFQATVSSATHQFETAISELRELHRLVIEALRGSVSNYEKAESTATQSANSIESAGRRSAARGTGSGANGNWT